MPPICLPPLPPKINFPREDSLKKAEYKIMAEVGIYDDPDNPIQNTYSVDLSNQNMMIIGSSQTGKTNLLQTIIRSVTTKYSPQEVNLYIIDFASMFLRNFETLSHVGGVITAAEDEKLKNLFKLLYREIEDRKERLLTVGVSSFCAYREAGRKDLPQIIVIIDNLTALKELYFQDDNELLNLCREGLTVGISVIIANAQTSGIGYRYLSNFACRIALFNNDSAEYGSLFDHCRERISEIQGRTLIELDKVHLECQMFLAFGGEKEIERVTEIKTFINEINQRQNGLRAKRIPVIPSVLMETEVLENYGTGMKDYKVLAGMDFATVSPYWILLHQMGALVLSGKEGMGKHNFLRYIVKIMEKYYEKQAHVYIVDSINRKLSDLKESPVVRKYEMLPEQAVELVKNIANTLKTRYEAVSRGDDELLSTVPVIVLIINNVAAMEAISGDISAMDAYSDIVGRYKNMNVCVFIGDYENANISYSSPEILKKLRDAKHFLFFDDLANLKIFDLPIAAIRENRKSLKTGEAYYIRENEIVKLKTPKCSLL